MKYSIYLLGLTMFFFSCNNDKKSNTPVSNTKTMEKTQELPNKKQPTKTIDTLEASKKSNAPVSNTKTLEKTQELPNKDQPSKVVNTSKVSKTPEAIQIIRKHFSAVNTSISNYSKKENNDINVSKDTNPNKYAFESTSIYRLGITNLERYYEGNELKKAIVTFNGDREDLVSEYYFWNNALFFVFKTKNSYKKPKWDDDFQKSDVKKFENRFYFQNDKLIRWLDPQKKQIDVKKAESKKMAQEILSDSQLYKNLK